MTPRATQRTPSSLLISVAIHGALIALAWRSGVSAPLRDFSIVREAFEVSMDRSSPSRRTNKVKTGAPAAMGVATTESTAPAPTQEAVDVAAGTDLVMLIRSRIEQKTHYPLSLRRRGVAGRVELSLSLDENGAIQEARVSRSSGSPELDQLAMDAVQNAAPFDEAISQIRAMGRAMGKLNLNLPIEFKLN